LSSAAIVGGSLAERMIFSRMLIFFFLWHCLVYCPIAHWVWGGGFLQEWGVIDFAGGTVVHIVSGNFCSFGLLLVPALRCVVSPKCPRD